MVQEFGLIGTNKVVINNEGIPYEILCIGTDNTTRKRAEEALRVSEEKFRQMVERSNDVFYRQDINTACFEYVSPKIYDMLGFQPEEILAMGLEEQKVLFHPNDLPGFLHFRFDLIDADNSGKRFIEREFRLSNKQGNYRWIHGNYMLFRDKDSQPHLIVGGMHDITERKMAEAALRESEERFRIAFENAAIGVCLVSLDKRLLKVNNALCRMLGYVAAELENMTSDDVTHPDDMERSCQFYANVLRGDFRLNSIEKRYLHKQGQVVWGGLSISLIRGTDNSPLYFLSHIQDITDRIHQEEKHKQLEAQLNHIQKLESLGILAGGVAHDFNNILAVIFGYSEILTMKLAKGDPARETVKNILKAADRAKDLVKQILNFSRQNEEQFLPADLLLIVKDTMKMLRASIPSSIEIQEIFPFDKSIINANPTQIQQVLMNLVTNAVHSDWQSWQNRYRSDA